ncbi:hypothetical protein AsAng_0045350 [Aureispira anguillae]|uniref:Uncharacterized protein n=1 Tax=Aureispira anguillae TaxID=2864201 RepID=A0A915YJ36_9BACT|nr:hypothetical protein AsAng_0045350 [Aureispira anguillae]
MLPFGCDLSLGLEIKIFKINKGFFLFWLESCIIRNEGFV